MEYKPGRGNVVADALSSKVKLSSNTASQCDIQEAIRDGRQHDPDAKKLMDMAAQWKTRHFWVEDDFLLTTGQRVYVTKFGSIK